MLVELIAVRRNATRISAKATEDGVFKTNPPAPVRRPSGALPALIIIVIEEGVTAVLEIAEVTKLVTVDPFADTTLLENATLL